MKIEKPPAIDMPLEILKSLMSGQYNDFLEQSEERYYYWDELKYKKGLPFENIEDNWMLIKAYRAARYETIQFGKYMFYYYTSANMLKQLHDFDLKLMGGLLQSPLSSDEEVGYFVNSLMEEAVASSQVEGAATTTKVAKEMLKSGRNPRDESEQMIFNNLRAIQYVREFQDEKLDFLKIFELHRIMTANTNAAKFAGGFRKETVFVTDHVDGQIAHIPPHWNEVETLMQDLCDFANDDNKFVHPIIKASIIHFIIGYIHPFNDGNGRTARALFYWYLLKKGYKLIKNISISKVILESRTQYDRAFLQTENDNHDLNYFIAYSFKNIRIAFDKLKQYRDRKLEDRKKAGSISFHFIEMGLNKRQADLLGYLYVKSHKHITLKAFAEKHNIVRQTASKDLQELVKMGLLKEDKSIKPYQYKLTGKERIDQQIMRGGF